MAEPTNSAEVPIIDPEGRRVGALYLKVLGDTESIPARLEIKENLPTPKVRLLEGCEYQYEWRTDLVPETDSPELFSENDGGKSGRLRTQLYTGTLRIRLHLGSLRDCVVELEVRSRKLSYEFEYRWMLRDITQAFSDALLLRFAASQHHFEPDHTAEAQNLYQRFAFLQSVLESGPLAGALRHISARPYLSWRTQSENLRPSYGLSPSSQVARQLTKPGPRSHWSAGCSIGLTTLPRRVSVERTHPNVDNTPNRFVRYALERWQFVVEKLANEMDAKDAKSNAILRGRREARALLARIDGALGDPLFREVGRLRQFPASNQVLQKKPGYRTIFRTFLQSELAATLQWEGGEDVYGAGKRDVATLYEYWCYITLAQILAELTHGRMGLDQLLDRTGIRLRGGQRVQLSGSLVHKGVNIKIALHFNRTFHPGKGTWTRSMRPDCSVELRAEDSYQEGLESLWLHFDAKYRVSLVSNIFGQKSSTDDELQLSAEREKRTGVVKRSDLLKMHAYRDAIRRSEGAYVLFPGDEAEQMPWYKEEPLPGLGAFMLRPVEVEGARGTADLHAFLQGVLDHLADQESRHQRRRFWSRQAYQSHLAHSDPHWLPRPAQDDTILLGYVRNPSHLRWIKTNRLYNLRADPSRDGAVVPQGALLRVRRVLLYSLGELCALYGSQGWFVSQTAKQLMETGYENPGGQEYYCLRLLEPEQIHVDLSIQTVLDLTRQKGNRSGGPVLVSAKELGL